jgi:hypothetical protein
MVLVPADYLSDGFARLNVTELAFAARMRLAEPTILCCTIAAIDAALEVHLPR